MQKLILYSKKLLKYGIGLGVIGVFAYFWNFAPISVATHEVTRGSITAEVMGTGTLEARISTTISPKIAGRIIDVLADQGASVTEGTELVLLDDEELRQQVAIAEANVEAAEAAIARVEAEKNRALAIFEQSKLNYDRVESLVKQQATSQQDVDQAFEALSVAQASVAGAEAAIVEAQKQLTVTKRTLLYQTARLQDTVVSAPFDGLVVKRHREAGDVAVPGSPILTLISTDELWISAWVDETQMSKLSKGQNAQVVFRSDADQSFSGQVARLGREADRETREFIVDVRVLELPENWAVGQRAETYINVGSRENVVVLPADLLTNHNGESGVFIAIEGHAVWRPLRLGFRQRGIVEVLDGINEGDVIVTPVNAKASLTDGRKVAPQ